MPLHLDDKSQPEPQAIDWQRVAHGYEAVMLEAAHLAATLATAETGHARNRIMSVSNMLNAVMGRTQSSHGDQFDMLGHKIEK